MRAKGSIHGPCMEIHGNGGPLLGALTPWTGEWKTKGDRTVFRTPESRALQLCKNEIQLESRWDDFKKLTNPYEYVFLSWNRRTSRSVCTRQPLSRSYFKMIEIWNVPIVKESLEQLVGNDGHFLTAHAAEGPGGFIEASWRKATDAGWRVDATFAITLRSEAKNVPGWRKAARFLTDRPAIQISDGADGTGNILLLENQNSFIATVRSKNPQGVHLYTADGGFDFSSDYNAQEDVIFPLLLAESLLGIQVLKKGGCFVLKLFDTTERPTLDLLWLLSRCFREWTIMKPKTSRSGNAERYFIGTGFLGDSADIRNCLLGVQERQTWNLPILCWPEADPAYKGWLEAVLRLQELIEHQEYTIIRNTLNLIHHHDFSRVRSLIRDNIRKSIEWCEEFGEPISLIWFNDYEKNITKETQDLLQILSPEKYTNMHYHSWYNRMSSVSSTLSFEGFRSSVTNPESNTSTTTTLSNPFLRYNSIFRV